MPQFPILSPRVSVLCIVVCAVAGGAAAARSATNLTGVVLDNRDGDCGAYVGEYSSESLNIPTGTDFEGAVNISASQGECTFTVNQIPNHDTGAGARWPHQVGEVEDVLTIPRNPEIAAAPTPLGLGAAALLLNGIKWEAYPAACFNEGRGRGGIGAEAIGCGPRMLDHPWRYNVGSPLNTGFSFDNYYAHVQRTGMYHYHSTPRVLYTGSTDIVEGTTCDTGVVSPVIGFAGDGFPLFGPCFADETGTVRAAQSSYAVKQGERQDVGDYLTPYAVGNVRGDDYDGQFIGDHEYVAGSGDLDECNGMTVDGQYGYYVTRDYPYALTCFSGTPSQGFD